MHSKIMFEFNEIINYYTSKLQFLLKCTYLFRVKN